MNNHLGDDGRTLIPSLGRVSKSHLLVKCLSRLDTAQAFIGDAKLKVDFEYIALLDRIQQLLYLIMSELSTSKTYIPSSTAEEINLLASNLESKIQIPNKFIIPGDSPAESASNIARTAIRDAEISFIELYESDPQKYNSSIITLINRFSWITYLIQIDSTKSIEYANRPRDVKVTNGFKD